MILLDKAENKELVSCLGQRLLEYRKNNISKT